VYGQGMDCPSVVLVEGTLRKGEYGDMGRLYMERMLK